MQQLALKLKIFLIEQLDLLNIIELLSVEREAFLDLLKRQLYFFGVKVSDCVISWLKVRNHVLISQDLLLYQLCAERNQMRTDSLLQFFPISSIKGLHRSNINSLLKERSINRLPLDHPHLIPQNRRDRLPPEIPQQPKIISGGRVVDPGLDDKIEHAIGVEIEVANEIHHPMPYGINIMGISHVDKQKSQLCVSLVVLAQQTVLALLVVYLCVDAGCPSLEGCDLHQTCTLRHPFW